MTNLNTLTDADLDQVCGGMDCKSGAALAQLYSIIGFNDALLGNDRAAAQSFAKADGIIAGACGK